MKPRQLLIYLVIFLAVGLFYYFFEIRLEKKEAQLKEAQTKIYNLPADRVTAVKYRNGAEEFRLVRSAPDEWRLTEPIRTPADRWEVERMLDAVLNGEKDRVFTEPVDNLAEFGLDRPQIALTLMSGSEILAPTLAVGHENPLGFLYYARLGDSREVFTVVAPLRQELDKSLFDLRDKSVILFPGEKIDGLRIIGREEIELKKKGLRRWAVVKPEACPADNDEVQEIVYRALKGRVQAFAEPAGDDEKYGFDRPRVKVEVLAEGETAAELIVGGVQSAQPDDESEQAESKGYWARSSERPEIFIIGPEIAEALDRSFFEIKDRHVLDFEGYNIEVVEVRRGQARFRAEKVQGIWEVKEPREAVSGDSAVVSFIMTLEDLKYVENLGSAEETVRKFGLDRPDLSVKLTAGDQVVADLVVSLVPAEDGRLAARHGAGPVVLIDQKALLASLPQEIKPPEEKRPKENQGD